MVWRSSATAILILIKLIAVCGGDDSASCVDSDSKCSLWASQGECQSNAVWMMSNCRRSCQSCQGGDRAWKLRTHIASTYDNSTSNVTKMVKIESVRINHVDIDEAKQLVRVFGRMVMSWNDSKIAWDKELWGISWLNFYWIQVWTPQIVQVNAPNPLAGSVSGKVLAANYTGQVYMWTDFSFVAPYHFSYEDYPNDYQKICYKFDEKRYFTVRFKVSPEVKNRQHEAISEAHVSGWTIEDLDVSDSKYVVQVLGDWKQNPFDIQTNNCELCIGLRRNAAYYFTGMLLPALITTILTLSSVVFQLTKTQPIILAFSLSSQFLALILINSRLPVFTAETPTILKYAGFNLFVTTLLFVISLILRKMALTTSTLPPPRFLTNILSYVDKFLPSFGDSANEKESGESESQGPYAHIAYTLNNLIFACLFMIYIVVIAFSFLI
uniref:ShKT domain-containing protein n=1 Tax=Panagrolaimus sp. JU765 TaxID=591449 RepID=A0AC34QS95_9BILA